MGEVAAHIFGGMGDPMTRMRRAAALDRYAMRQQLTAAPDPDIARFFEASEHAAIVRAPLQIPIPRLNLGFTDVLRVRTDEEVFARLCETLGDVLTVAHSSLPGEGPEDYARRIREAGAEQFESLMSDLIALRRRAWFAARLVPKAASLAVKLGLAGQDWSLPGAAAGAGKLSERTVKRQLARVDVRTLLFPMLPT